MRLVYLSGEHIPLARAEAIKSFGTKPTKTQGRVLIFNSRKIPKNLAYTEYILELFYFGNKKNFSDMTRKFNWNKKITGTYALRALTHTQIPLNNIADIIWRQLKNPKVNLTKPQNTIGIIAEGFNFFIGKILWKNPKGFSKRRAHLREKNHPTSLCPKLARACINLLDPVNSVMDPFCGTGGILLEAGLMGHKITGFDNDKKMLKNCKKNLQQFRLKFRLTLRDARVPDKRYKYIVTDLPYGRNTKNVSKELYETFLNSITHVKRAVVIFPDKKYIKLAKKFFLVEESFTYYIHKSLSKYVLLLKTRE